jgi:hypothetical protein
MRFLLTCALALVFVPEAPAQLLGGGLLGGGRGGGGFFRGRQRDDFSLDLRVRQNFRSDFRGRDRHHHHHHGGFGRSFRGDFGFDFGFANYGRSFSKFRSFDSFAAHDFAPSFSSFRSITPVFQDVIEEQEILVPVRIQTVRRQLQFLQTETFVRQRSFSGFRSHCCGSY